MFSVSKEVHKTGVSQPLLFINSFDFQWKQADMMKLVNHGNAPTNVCVCVCVCVCVYKIQFSPALLYVAVIINNNLAVKNQL